MIQLIQLIWLCKKANSYKLDVQVFVWYNFWKVGWVLLQSNFIEIALRHGCSPVNLLHIFRTRFPGLRLLNFSASKFIASDKIYWVYKKQECIEFFSGFCHVISHHEKSSDFDIMQTRFNSNILDWIGCHSSMVTPWNYAFQYLPSSWIYLCQH